MDYISGDDSVSNVNRTDETRYYRRFNYPMNRDNSVGYKSGLYQFQNLIEIMITKVLFMNL